MSTNKIEALKKKQAEELIKAEQEQSILDALADVPGFNPDKARVCIQSVGGLHASVTLWDDFRCTRPLADAVAVVQHFAYGIVEGEHWNDGCVSTWPAAINSCAKKERATMDGSHAVEISVKGGKGYGPDVSVKFWARLAGILCEIHCPVCDQYKLVPRVQGHHRRDGSFEGKVEWNPAETQTADKLFRKFWSEAPSYSGSYYLADVPNFEAWASNHMPAELAKV